MRLASHMFVAEKAAEIVEQLVGISFNHKLLKIGACTPDIQPIRRMQIHSPRIVTKHFEKEFLRVVDKEKKINRISFILGILSHYIADAFCLSHNWYMLDMKRHVQYEHFLDGQKYDIELSKDMIEEALKQVDHLQNDYCSVEEYLQNENKAYLQQVEGQSWEQIINFDLEKAIIHSAVVLTHFVWQLQEVRVPAVCIA